MKIELWNIADKQFQPKKSFLFYKPQNKVEYKFLEKILYKLADSFNSIPNSPAQL
jgi:hypothetical protein